MPQLPDTDDNPRNDPRIIQAMSNRLRVRFLEMLSDRPALTPAEGLNLLGDSTINLSVVSYHAKVLCVRELVERLGADSGFAYRLTAKGTLALAAFGLLPTAEGSVD